MSPTTSPVNLSTPCLLGGYVLVDILFFNAEISGEVRACVSLSGEVAGSHLYFLNLRVLVWEDGTLKSWLVGLQAIVVSIRQ